MAKRFTDTNKWKKPFVRSLPLPYKLFWFYLLDDCDHAGIWIVDIEVAQIRIGETLDIKFILNAFNDKIIIFDNGERWFIPAFVEFQYGKLNEVNRAHNSVINTLSKYKLLDKNKDLISPLQGAKEKDKELDKDKDKEKRKCLMKNSGMTQQMIHDSFQKTNDIKTASPQYYYNTAMAWSNSKGEMRIDWIATIGNFARRDLKDGKMQLARKFKVAGELAPEKFGVFSEETTHMPDSLKKKYGIK